MDNRSYWGNLHRSALATALKDLHLEGGGVVSAVLIFLIYTILVWTQISAEEAGTEIVLKVLSTLAPLSLLPGAYLIRLFTSARNLQMKSEERIAELTTALERNTQSKIKLDLEIFQMVHGGQSVEDPEDSVVYLLVAIRNLGDKDSSTDGWKMWVNNGGIRTELPLGHATSPMRFGIEGQHTLVLDPEDAIYIKAATPIPARGQVKGFIGSKFKRREFPEITPDTLFGCSTVKMDGEVISDETGGGQAKNHAEFYPGLNLRYEPQPKAH